MMKKPFDLRLRRFVPFRNEHLSDQKLADLICREMTLLERWIAERHLTTCRHCRGRQWRLEGQRAQGMLDFYAEVSRRKEDDSLSEKSRATFAQWLQLQVRRAELRRQEHLALRLRAKVRASLPGIAVGMTVGLAIGAVAFSFAWRRVPAVTANSLLVHAEKWDAAGPAAAPGVVHQTINIKDVNLSLNRSLYWDLQGKRRVRRVAVSGREKQLMLELGRAGVDWERPISASAYQDWHDHQHVRSDRITKTGRHLLTLTTTVPDGLLSQQSITIRDTDFHPIERTIGFRDSGTVEIAELDYSVLPWSAVDSSAFEPVEAVSLHEVAPLPRLSLEISKSHSPEQLDETELAARLILNQLHADGDEQIEVRRTQRGVEVEGLVSTEDRKRELNTQLMTVPGLEILIRSEEDLSKSVPSPAESTSMEAVALPDNPSALDNYLRHRGRPVEEINRVERQLFEEALTISKESRSIVELKSRFAHADQMPVVSLATLEELLYSHHERLEQALREERALVGQAQEIPESTGGPLAPAELSLTAAAETNLALARELTQTNLAHPRSAEEIFADMTSVLDRLSPAAREAYIDPAGKPDSGSKQ